LPSAKLPSLLIQARASLEQRQKISEFITDLLLFLDSNLDKFSADSTEIEMSEEYTQKSDELYPFAEATAV
jgi:hypothetical protein